MKRSQINSLIREAEAFLQKHSFLLPPFSRWNASDWHSKRAIANEIMERNMGWDITDFGSGDFAKVGLFLFTVRNGSLKDLERGQGKVYAEKIMIVEVGQYTPYHFHWKKVEDIINRGGGKLILQLANASADESALLDTDVIVSIDGVKRRFKAREEVVLEPGESITLPTKLYHQFFAVESRTLVGEISTVNDDHTDNRFLDPVGRFPEIEEDEPPYRLLTRDYHTLK